MNPELTGMTELKTLPMTKFLVLTYQPDYADGTFAVPLARFDLVEIESFEEDDGTRPWRLRFTDLDGDDYHSPMVPTRDDAIALLRQILESNDVLVDVAALVGASG